MTASTWRSALRGGLLVVAGTAALLVPAAAAACGSWYLEDLERGWRVQFLVSSVATQRPGSARQVVLRIGEEHPDAFSATLGAWAPRQQPALQLREGRVLLHGRFVASLSDDTLRVGDTKYEIELTSSSQWDCRLGAHSGCTVGVTRGALVVARGSPLSFLFACSECGAHGPEDSGVRCGGGPADASADTVKRDIRNRVALYLVWRDLVHGGATAGQHGSDGGRPANAGPDGRPAGSRGPP